MIDPIVAVTVTVAFALAIVTILVARRISERPQDRQPGDSQREPERRYVNGGWH